MKITSSQQNFLFIHLLPPVREKAPLFLSNSHRTIRTKHLALCSFPTVFDSVFQAKMASAFVSLTVSTHIRGTLSPGVKSGQWLPCQRVNLVRTPSRSYRVQSFPMMTESKPPINAPSGVLLLSSSVLAIAAIGCVFEITGGHPTYGFNTTASILVVSLPSFLFLFYSAIKKGQLEALDDS